MCVKKMIINWVLSAVCIWLLALVFPGVTVDGFGGALVAALVLGLVNAVIKPIIHLLSLPLTILTLGLFSLVINALMLMLAANLTNDFSVDGFGTAFVAAIVLSLLNMIFIKDEKDEK
jgi:putative membrane protein